MVEEEATNSVREEMRLEIPNWDKIARARNACLSLHLLLLATANLPEGPRIVDKYTLVLTTSQLFELRKSFHPNHGPLVSKNDKIPNFTGLLKTR